MAKTEASNHWQSFTGPRPMLRTIKAKLFFFGLPDGLVRKSNQAGPLTAPFCVSGIVSPIASPNKAVDGSQ